jgi:hypothetical protein
MGPGLMFYVLCFKTENHDIDRSIMMLCAVVAAENQAPYCALPTTGPFVHHRGGDYVYLPFRFFTSDLRYMLHVPDIQHTTPSAVELPSCKNSNGNTSPPSVMYYKTTWGCCLWVAIVGLAAAYINQKPTSRYPTYTLITAIDRARQDQTSHASPETQRTAATTALLLAPC